ncbi:SDR family NAD(P)-dependent oxidoreductase, partial [Streptococcus anginosus]|nr:SDR family NAD(P)-dependent oxidoreductase [Streptococcus anginosus]
TPVGVDLRGAEFEADLSTPEGIADAVARVVEKYPQIDGVIANAGTQSNSPLDLKVNYFGARDTVRAFLPYLEKAENGRAVITA